jgi:hypothetical protein
MEPKAAIADDLADVMEICLRECSDFGEARELFVAAVLTEPKLVAFVSDPDNKAAVAEAISRGFDAARVEVVEAILRGGADSTTRRVN